MRARYLAIVLFLLPHPTFAQSGDDPMSEGIVAFRDGRYEEAAIAFERVTREDPDRAEAHFLLARVYTETPLADRRRAENALDRALQLEPNNVTYLVGRLRQLRQESWNFFVERIREQKRIDLAQEILKLDSTNAFAHEELGASFIRDFWRYRNAVMLPTMSFNGSSFRARNTAALGDDPFARRSPEADDEGVMYYQLGHLGAPQAPQMSTFDPNRVFPADRFDVESLERMGVPVHDLAARAQRSYERAIGHLNASLETDPRRRSVYEYLMEIYALKGEYGTALSMLAEMYTFYAEDPVTWLYMGLSHYHADDLEAASRAFETAFRYMSPTDRAAFESLDHLLPSAEQSSYREDPVAYASRYWTSKDPRYLTPYNERKLEHFARLVYADLLYGSDDLDLRGWDTERGRIVVRYGPPQRDVVIVPGSTSRIGEVGLSPESQADAATTLTPSDMNYAPRSAHVGGEFDMMAEANTFNVWDYGDFRFVFEDPFRNGEFRLYSPSASDISGGVPPWLNDYTIRARETFARIPDRYEYEAPGRQIEIPFLVSAFKGEGGADFADLYVQYGIPIAAEGVGQHTINVSANVGTFLVSDRRDILVERRRTIYGLRGENVRSFEDAHLWIDSQMMTAPAGRHEVSMEFETSSGATVAVQRRELDVPDYETQDLQISDVMLAYAVEETYETEPVSGSVQRRGLSITPAPWSVFSHEQPIYLYFEVYQLSFGADGRTQYEMEAELTRKDDSNGVARFVKNLFGGADGVSVSLPGSGSSSDDGHYLILDAANQGPGLYELTLRVRDGVAGQVVERKTDLFLE